MTVTLDALGRARPGVLREVASALARERALLEQVLTELVAGQVEAMRWTGPAALAAGLYAEGLRREVSVMYRGVTTTGRALTRAADALDEATTMVRRAEGLAADARGRLDAQGRLVVPPRPWFIGDATSAALAAREEERLRWDVEALVARALEVAAAADRELAHALESVVSDNACFPSSPEEIALRPPGLPAGRPTEWLAYASAAWWATLSPAEQEWVVHEHPEWVGPRDGVPARTRHAANLVLLMRAERQAREAMDDLTSPGRIATQPLALGLVALGLRERLREHLDDLSAVRMTLAQADGIERQLLLVDTSGPVVKAVVAVGDVDRAEHVATFVGGFTTSARRDLERYDRAFTRMRERALTESEGEDLAIVTWMGYPAPQVAGLVSWAGRSVLSDTIARQGAAPLASFVNGIDAARERPAHQTLWAHSYGSVVTGFALQRNGAFDDVVLFGSPGVAFTSLSQAGLKPGALNVLKADWDLVPYPHWFGTDPAEVPGATLLSTSRSKPTDLNAGLGSSGHSAYLKAGTTSERNLIAVALDRPDLRVLAGDR